MFDNYSVADLFANIYKKRVLNLISLIVLFLVLALPYSYRALTTKSVVKDTSNYSSYLSYKITAPEEEITKSNINNTAGGYSDFYGRLIQANLNGAYLFNDQSEEVIKEIASELGTTAVTLKNSNFDFWSKKIEVNSLLNNAGVTVKILTPSKLANDIIEKKLDYLIDKYKQTYSGVTIEKLDTVYSEELKKNDRESGVSKTTILMRLIVLGIGSLILVIFVNIAVYIFNPTINRVGEFEKYGVDFVVKIDNIDNFQEIIQYKNEDNNLLLIGTNKKVIDKFSKEFAKVLPENIVIGNVSNIKSILDSDNILFVEEFGITRYKNFEEQLQVIKNLNKNVLGVATYNL